MIKKKTTRYNMYYQRDMESAIVGVLIAMTLVIILWFIFGLTTIILMRYSVIWSTIFFLWLFATIYFLISMEL